MSLDLIEWDALGAYRVAFTTRVGGVSTGAFESLNLGLLTHDERDRVEENRRRVCEQVGVEVARLAMNRQRHGVTVNRAVAGERGREGDGLWTEEQRLPLLKLTADCLPIAIARTNGPPGLALLHAGWRGLLEGVIEAGVAALGRGTLAAAIGPGIGPCCYEVRADVADPFHARFGSGAFNGENLDLWTVAERMLREAGVMAVERADLCTACNPGQFFSHRRDGAVTGRQGVIGYVA
jgi:YfiH family protein